MRNYLVILLACVLCNTACQRTPTERTPVASPADNRFDSLKLSFVEEMWQLDPSSASYRGRHEFDSLLTIPTAAYLQQMKEWRTAWLDTLSRQDTADLSISNKIDYKMIRDQLVRGRWYDEEYKIHEWNPASYNIGSQFAVILNGRYAPLDERMRALSGKLNKVPAYYEAAASHIKTPTIEHTDLAISQNQGALTVLGKSMEDSLNISGLSTQEKDRYMQNLQAARGAVERYIDRMRTVRNSLTPATARNFRIGKEQFARKFELDMVAGLTADQVYEKALARKEGLHEQMTTLARQLWPKHMGTRAMPADSLAMIRQVIDKLSLQHAHRDSFIVFVERQIPELIDFVNRKDLLTQDPDKPLVIRPTPPYLGGVAVASISAPGPYDSGADTYYNVLPLDNFSDQQAESFLREYNDYILQILNIHEAIPGHYTQLVYANRSPSIIKSLFGNGAMIEGWAVYTELMMLEEGYNNSPEMWLMYYKWNMRVTMNTILDYRLHNMNISEQEGVRLLMEEAFQEEAEATGKWKRATLSQVQLCSYFTGFQAIYDLREELKRQQGNRFNLKAFHEEFLSFGSSPVAYIRQLMVKNQ
jgi:uncharacterized protein (DUF885 family)